MKLIPLDVLIAEIKELKGKISDNSFYCKGWQRALRMLKLSLDTLEVKGVDLEKEIERVRKTHFINDDFEKATLEGRQITNIAKHFFELGIKVQHDNWKVVDNTNLSQGDRTKIYCVFTKQKYILATVINHPQDEDLLQWKCTEFPFRRYDMCEGDKYMQIV